MPGGEREADFASQRERALRWGLTPATAMDIALISASEPRQWSPPDRLDARRLWVNGSLQVSRISPFPFTGYAHLCRRRVAASLAGRLGTEGKPMSFLLVTPEALGSAAADIRQIGSTVGAGNLAAAIPTIQLTTAATDEVSVAIAAVFGTRPNQYQAAAALAATYHERFARALSAAAASYAGAEASIDTTLRDVVTAANTGASNGFQTLVYAPIHTAGKPGSTARPVRHSTRSSMRPPTRCWDAI